MLITYHTASLLRIDMVSKDAIEASVASRSRSRCDDV